MDVLKTYISPTRIGGPAVRKSKQQTLSSPTKPYLTWLLAFFAAWKLLLLLVAYASPGPGYDTSTRTLFEQYNTRPHSWLAGIVQNITLRLTRWDAIYFSTSSERGHLYEQEWAFSWFMSRLTALLSNGACLHLMLLVGFHRLSTTFQCFLHSCTTHPSLDMPWLVC